MSDDIALDDAGFLTFTATDKCNPRNWSTPRKLFITGTCMMLVMNATFASSAPSGTLQDISHHFGVSSEVSNLVTTLFLLGYVAGPFIWAPLSEFYGRRWIFQGSFIVYIAFNFLCAFAPNFGALLTGRFLTGLMASSALSNAPGVISDIWGPVARGNAMVFFMVVTFVGPALGPVVAGFLELKKTWRWTFYVLLSLAGVTEIVLIFLPETLSSAVLVRKARRLRHNQHHDKKILAPMERSDKSLPTLFKDTLTRPWRLLVDPINLLVTLYYAVIYTLLYMLFSIYPIVFRQKRGWNAGVGQLPFLGVVVGACIGGIVLYALSMRSGSQSQEATASTPEKRLPAAMVGSILFPLTMLWFAWSAEYDSVPWIVPTLAGTFLATSILLLFAALINYVVDTYTSYAASAVAANTVVRSVCGAAGPIFTQYMFNSLGVSGGGSLIAGVAVLLSPIPFVFYRHGRTIRGRSSFTEAN